MQTKNQNHEAQAVSSGAKINLTQIKGHGAGGKDIRDTHPAANASDLLPENLIGRRVNEGINLTAREIREQKAIPGWAVSLTEGIRMETMPESIREHLRAEGQFTLGEIAKGLHGEVKSGFVRRVQVGFYTRGPRKGQPKHKTIAKSLRKFGRLGGREMVTAAQDFSQPAFDSASEWQQFLTDGGLLAMAKDEVEFQGTDEQAILRLSSIMARRAARYITHKRGLVVNETSLDEGRGAALEAIIREWYGGQTSDGNSRLSFEGSSVWTLGGVAWRAAFRALTDDGKHGLQGRMASQLTSCAPFTYDYVRDGGLNQDSYLAEDAATRPATHEQLLSLQSFFEDEGTGAGAEPIQPDGFTHVKASRRRVLSSLRQFFGIDRRTRGRGGAAALIASKQRYLVLAGMIRGLSFARACKLAGFRSQESAANSFRDGKIWLSLERFALAIASPWERELTAQARAHAKRSRVAYATFRASKGVNAIRHQQAAIVRWLAAVKDCQAALNSRARSRENRRKDWQAISKGWRAQATAPKIDATPEQLAAARHQRRDNRRKTTLTKRLAAAAALTAAPTREDYAI